MVASQKAWPENKKDGCVLKNKKNNYTELTEVCTSDVYSKHCTTDPDPVKCAACKQYDDATKPFPALTQCYKFNQKACCTSGHDATIKDAYSNILSTTCLREFPNLEFFYCLGCSDQQAEFVDVDRKIVHVCPTFAKELWNDIDYDRCGLALGGSSDWPFILPRIEYSDATTFLNIDGIKPPYFSGYTVVVDEKDGSNCFASSMAAIHATLSTAVVLLLSVVVSAML